MTIDQRRRTPTAVAGLERAMRREWPTIILFVVVCLVVTVVASSVQRPSYRSDAQLYVTSTGGDASALTAYAGSLAASQRMKSYAELITSYAVLSDAIQSARLDIDVDRARSLLSVSVDPSTVVIGVSAESSDKALTVALVNAVCESAVRRIADVETPAGGDSPMATATIISAASAEDAPVAPDLVQQLLIALAVGLVAALLLVAAKGRISDRIRVVGDLRDAVDLPILTEVPSDGRRVRNRTASYGDERTEAFRRLRTALGFLLVDSPRQVVMTTSSTADEGRLEVAVGLSRAIAESGSSVVLIDADMRRPRLHELVNAHASPGISDATQGEYTVDAVVQRTDLGDMAFVGAGRPAGDAAGLLTSTRFHEFLDAIADRFDVVVLNVPPVLRTATAGITARSADAVILVTDAGWTRTDDAIRATSELRHAGAPVIASVLHGSRRKVD